jgi:hypothetical protein
MRRSSATWSLLLAWPLLQAQPPEAVIEGTVINAATKGPISGAALRLAAHADQILARGKIDVEPAFTRTDAAGHFVFKALQPDVFLLGVRSPGTSPPGLLNGRMFVDLRLTPTPPPLDSNFADMTVEKSTDPDGTVRAKITIALTYYATIDGKVTSPDSLPMEGCLVTLYRELTGLTESQKIFALRIPGTQKQVSEMYGLTLITDDQGGYHAAHLEPGIYYVKEKCNEYGKTRLWRPGYWETYYPGATHIENARPIPIGAGETARADIRISEVKGVRVTGVLSNAPEATRVYLQSLDPLEFLFFRGTIMNGRYTIDNVLPGRYLLTGIDSDTAIAASRQIDLNRDLDGIDLALQPFPDLTGTVKFAEGCTPRPLKITLFQMAPTAKFETTDVDGRFVLRHLPPLPFGVEIAGQRSMNPLVRLGAQVGGTDLIRFGPALHGESLEIEISCEGSARQP